MCGIAGSYNIDVDLKYILDSQSYRGPDATGITTIPINESEVLHLGHNRLKVICLSDEANQPFYDESFQHVIVFNGEIYNYQEIKLELTKLGATFRTLSDTEVLLQAMIFWGESGLTKLDGMFAFAYYNKPNRTLLLARDRFGVKPLYYFSSGDRLVFASTSHAIAKSLGLKPALGYLSRGLQFGIYENSDELTAYSDLKMISPGTLVQFQLGSNINPVIKQYYDFRNAVETKRTELSQKSTIETFNELNHQLTQSCKKRLISDVPFAIALSDGLDSSSICTIVQDLSNEVNAFCFGNPVDGASEGRVAKKFALEKGVNLHFITHEMGDWVNSFWQTLDIQDAPFASMSVVAQYMLYKGISQNGYKVALGGQGGDEGFMGYRKFQLFYMKELLQNKEWLNLSQYLFALKKMIWAERSQFFRYWSIRERYYKNGGQLGPLSFDRLQSLPDFSGASSIDSRQIRDVLDYSLPTLLRYEDRNSMAHGVESRLPFMDYRLLEFGCALPIKLKINDGYGKWIVRHVMKDRLPKEICWSRFKRGFDVVGLNKIYEYIYPSIRREISANLEFYETAMKLSQVEQYFQPRMLVKYPRRFIEMTTLLWLRKRS